MSNIDRKSQSKIFVTAWFDRDDEAQVNWTIVIGSDLVSFGECDAVVAGEKIMSALREQSKPGSYVTVSAPLQLQIQLQTANNRAEFVGAHLDS